MSNIDDLMQIQHIALRRVAEIDSTLPSVTAATALQLIADLAFHLAKLREDSGLA